MSDLSLQQKNLFQQGYQSYTPAQLKEIDWGLRFTPGVCSLIALYGLITQNPVILFSVALLGILAFFFPSNHPMDMIYNQLVRKLFNAEKLPPNPFQRRLACFAAGIMNTAAALFFLASMPIPALITGGLLLILQAIVIFTHFCTLSWMYEGFMRLIGRWNVPMDLKEAKELLQSGATLIDVRGPDEFAGGHLNSAKNLPLDDIVNHLENLKSEVNILLYCASGTRSQIAKQKLSELGLTNIFDLGSMDRAKEIVA